MAITNKFAINRQLNQPAMFLPRSAKPDVNMFSGQNNTNNAPYGMKDTGNRFYGSFYSIYRAFRACGEISDNYNNIKIGSQSAHDSAMVKEN